MYGVWGDAVGGGGVTTACSMGSSMPTEARQNLLVGSFLSLLRERARVRKRSRARQR